MRNLPGVRHIGMLVAKLKRSMHNSSGVRIIVWLGACGVLLVVAGVVTLQWVPWPPVPQPISIEVDDSLQVKAVHVEVENATSASYRLNVTILSNSPSDLDDPDQGSLAMVVTLPEGDTRFGGSQKVSLDDSDFKQVRALQKTVSIDVVGNLFGVGTDGPDAIVALPQIAIKNAVSPGDPNGKTTDASVRVEYPITNSAQLAWLEMRPSQAFGVLQVWAYPLTSGATPTATATNITVLNERQFFAFLSGGLFALGGSALISAIPEVIREREKRRIARSAVAGEG